MASGVPIPVGIVLAGGASRRMGRDKALLEIDGWSLAERAAARLREAVAEVAVADGGRGLVADLLSLPDSTLGRGPVAGILGAAHAYPGRALLVLACDLPGVPAALLRALAAPSIGRQADWTVPRHAGGLEPLSALYAPRALAVLEERAAGGLLSLWDLAETSGLAVRYFEGEALAAFGPPEQMFANLNTPADLAEWAR
jgi:molybdopterin-guanine dinucleotide biosynthesis protein A